MTSSLPASTQHRLQQLPQIPSVWEGDRRPLNTNRGFLEQDQDQAGDCILWVDGSEGLVRSMDVIPEDAGLETVVRTLIRAMEVPRAPAPPCRPQKIVVRNREIQFLLRGVLQGLDISIDYQPSLPLIDELFRTFESPDLARPDPLPPDYTDPLESLADQIWEIAPWEVLADHDIIALELRLPEGEQTLYACVMGMLGQEYGIILYRSLESLRQFREMALEEKSPAALEQAFLSQDCWFLNYEFEDEDADPPAGDSGDPVFGSIHPLEGIRPFLDESEALTLYFALEGLRQFVKNNSGALSHDPIPPLHQRLRIKHPLHASDKTQELIINVATQPALAAEFIAQLEGDGEMDEFSLGYFDDDDDDDNQPVLQDDLIPDNAYMSLGMIPWDLVELIRVSPSVHYQAAAVSMKGDGMPVLMIQTSRPKAKELINRLREEGPITGLGFNLGEDPWTETKYDLGVLKTQPGHLFLFGEFLFDSPTHKQARKNWERRCKATKGHCAVLIAMGVTGQSKGNPKLQHMLGYFETEFLSHQALGIGPLQLMPNLDFDF
ncbi:MAG: hypothetical protein VKJ27_08355 [Synechocystis sp.]|nr:hypothetical protein [Synechocystis sp.]